MLHEFDSEFLPQNTDIAQNLIITIREGRLCVKVFKSHLKTKQNKKTLKVNGPLLK